MSHILKPPAKAATKARGDTTTQQPKHTDKQNGCKCPQCGASMSMYGIFLDEWMPDLHMLAARHASMGITSDLSALCLCQCYGLYLFLIRQGG